MDDSDQQRKQNAIRGYSGVPPLGSTGDGRPRQSGRPGQERPGQVPILSGHRTSPTMATGNASGYVYYEEGPQTSSLPLPHTTLQYPPEFTQDHQRQQTFSQYGPGLMYGITQQLPHSQSYDPVQPYQQRRRSAAIEVLSTQFAAGPTFYVPNEPVSAAAATVQSQSATTTFPSQTYPQQPSGARTPLATVYAPTMGDVQQIGAPQPIAAAPEYNQSPPNNGADYGQYQTAVRRTFEQIRSGQLAEAAQSLLEISAWLLANAAPLGFVRDDQNVHGERLKHWAEFNACWLSTLQQQKESTETMLRTGQRPTPPQTLIQQDVLEKLGHGLVHLCDEMERHGLVDYEMGVWEEEIVGMLEECLNLLEHNGNGDGPPAGHPTGSSGAP